MRKLGICLLGVMICLLTVFPVLATQRRDINRSILPLSEIERGMTGTGKTVIYGTEIEEFEVEILSVLENHSSSQDLILIEVSGELIEKTGGIAAGMSGSPIYIEGDLIGAIGYGWQLTNHKLGLVTPIEDMLDIWELGIDKRRSVFQLKDPLQINEQSIEQVKFVDSEAKVDSSEGSLLAYPAQTPLLVSGLGNSALEYLAEKLDNYNLEPMQSGMSSASRLKKESGVELEAGSAVAVQLAKGDIDIAAIGTLTYVEEDQVLGFAHPFLSMGNSNYFLSSAYIHHVIDSLSMPFKLGTPLNLEGVITQDRRAGVGGLIGQFPTIVPLKVRVNDQDLAKEQEVNVQLIRDEELLSALAGTVVYQSINSALDRQGGGTAQVKMEIMGNNLDDEIIKRENMFYNRNDVAAVALDDFLDALMLITYNPFKKVDLVSIELDIEVKEEPQVALIDEVSVLQDQIKAGDEIEIEVTFMPYRQERIIKNYTIQLPEDIETGTASLELIGGREANYGYYGYGDQGPEEEYGEGSSDTFKSLEEVLTAFEKQKINNDLVVRIMPDYSHRVMPAADEEEESDDLATESGDYDNGYQELEGLSEEAFRTDYILEGRIHTKIDIQAEKDDQS